MEHEPNDDYDDDMRREDMVDEYGREHERIDSRSRDGARD